MHVHGLLTISTMFAPTTLFFPYCARLPALCPRQEETVSCRWLQSFYHRMFRSSQAGCVQACTSVTRCTPASYLLCIETTRLGPRVGQPVVPTSLERVDRSLLTRVGSLSNPSRFRVRRKTRPQSSRCKPIDTSASRARGATRRRRHGTSHHACCGEGSRTRASRRDAGRRGQVYARARSVRGRRRRRGNRG